MSASQSAGATDKMAKLSELGVATLYEASKADIVCDPAIRPSWPGAMLCGPAFPVRCQPTDNLPIHYAVEQASRGDILVIDCEGVLAGYFGEMLATACIARGIAGVAIDGGTRDVAALTSLRFPVFSRGISVHRTGKSAPGKVGEPIVFAGVSVSRGDMVVADIDGLIIIPASEVDSVLEAGSSREKHEQQTKKDLRAGKTTVELYSLPPRT